MSYPLHTLRAKAASRSTWGKIGFWGLDLAGGAMERPVLCARETENLVWEGAALRRRPGYRFLEHFDAPIHGIFFWNTDKIIHAGERLWCLNAEGEKRLLFEGMRSAPSMGVLRRQTLTHRWCDLSTLDGWHRELITGDFLFINDGKNYLFYDGVEAHSLADPYWGGHRRNEIAAGEVYSTYSTVPIFIAGKTPDGQGGEVDPRGDNRLSQFRCDSFYLSADVQSQEFVLSCLYETANEGFPAEIQLRDSEGIWRSFSYKTHDFFLRCPNGRARIEIGKPLWGGMPISVNETGRVVGVSGGDQNLADDGLDNLRITYAIFKDPPDALTGATVQGLYGANAADNVLFLGGSSVTPGEDAFSAADDFACFYETSTERLGSTPVPITGYCRLKDGRLAILKNDPNGANVYFRSHTLVTLGQIQVDAYPSRMGAAVEGCVSAHTLGIAGNEPIFLARCGLYGVRSVSDELINLDETIRRSIPVDPILSRIDPSMARAIGWHGYYLLSYGKETLLTDGQRDAKGNLRFLKWRFSHVITALGKKDHILYLGDEEGNLYRFGDERDDAGKPFCAYWWAEFPSESGGRRQILKQLSAAFSPAYEGTASAVLYREQTPAAPVRVALHRLDFEKLDFSEFTFDGSGDLRWVALPVPSVSGDQFSVRVDLESGDDLLLWGLRMSYAKGGMVR